MEELKQLYDLMVSGAASRQQEQRFLTLLALPENEIVAKELLHEYALYAEKDETIKGLSHERLLMIGESILFTDNSQTNGTASIHRIHFLKTTWFRYAAAIMLIFGVAAYFWMTNKKTTQTLVSNNKDLQTNIAPGRDRAILTLANGQQIMLDSTQGNIVKQGSLTVVNLAGKVKYDGVGTSTEYNIISTPKGGQYQIILPDGSKVWLNAVSSVKFPTAFTGSVRRVEVTGEVYMEVAKNSKQSFTVALPHAKTNGAEIQVLGTSFNVNAYEDESTIKTTLIEGSVKIINTNGKSDSQTGATVKAIDRQSVILKPGQQCSIFNDRLSVLVNADVKQALAWKNGVFKFNQVTLDAAMRQLARWYDIEVVYEKGVPDIKLEGGMERSLSSSQMLDALKELGVKFRMEGKQLIVMQ